MGLDKFLLGEAGPKFIVRPKDQAKATAMQQEDGEGEGGGKSKAARHAVSGTDQLASQPAA